MGGSSSAPSSPSLDPIFQAKEPADKATRSTALLWQYFLFPLLIVVAAVGVFFFFGWLGGSVAPPEELLDELTRGRESERPKAAQQLGLLLNEERRRVERSYAADLAAGTPRREIAFYERPGFRERLREAFRDSLADRNVPEERQVFFARALGVSALPGAEPETRATLEALESAVYPDPGEPVPSSTVRLHAAQAVVETSSRVAEPLLLRMAKDAGDSQIREVGLWGLARLASPIAGPATDSPEVRTVLTKALREESASARLHAALGLAARGDGAGKEVLLRALDRAALADLGISAPQRSDALVIALRGAAALGDAEFRPLVERLAKDDPDERVRWNARSVLDGWSDGRNDGTPKRSDR